MTVKDTILTQYPPERLFPLPSDSAWIVVAVEPRDYSASSIARAVEDCDAHLLNLNVLADHSDSDELLVALRADIRNSDAVVRSLERYGYRIVSVDNPENADDSDSRSGMDPVDTARRRANELLRYLSV